MNEELRTKEDQIDEILKICAGCRDKGTYQVSAICPNCGWRGKVTLSRGHRFLGYCTDCPRCACAGLMRVTV